MISGNQAPRPALLSILLFGEPMLEQPCSLVTLDQRPEAEHLAGEMLDTMIAAGGWGLSAPQVGVPLRMLVMHCHHGEKDYRGYPKTTPYVMVNPVIRDSSVVTVILNEGCLSFPGVRVPISRPRQVLVAWHDVHDWSVKAAMFDNWESRCIQHEVEHLDGKLLVHHLAPVAQKKMRRRAQKGFRL